MKINQIIQSSVFAACIVLLSNCTMYDYGYNNNDGYASEYQYSSARYDNDGFPIFGYQGGRPIYAYSNAGAPIFNITLISRHCYVPSWRPASHYHGHYRYASHVYYKHSIPSCAHQYKAKHYPRVNPSRPSHNSHGARDTSYKHKNESIPVYNRPSNGDIHSAKPEHPSYNGSADRPDRPSFGGNADRPSRPSFDGNADRPSRPSFDGNADRPSRPSFGGNADRPSRPSFDGNADRPSRPSFDGNADRPSRPSFGGNADRPSRPSFGGNADRPSRPSFGGNADRPSRPSFNNGDSPRPSAPSSSPSPSHQRPSRPEADGAAPVVI